MGKFWVNCLLILPAALYFGFGNSSAAKSTKNGVFLRAQSGEALDVRSVQFLRAYGPTIRKYSHKYGLDWRLVVAVMKIESQFQPKAASYSGAQGLMQIMPVTQSQIADELGFDESDFRAPHTNIRGGIYYLGKIYRSFGGQGISPENRIKLTLAAYNAGSARIADARAMAKYMNDDPNEWGSVKASLPLLARKYSSLQKHVWDDGKPASGYYSQWQQTTGYVESIMSYYAEYCKVVPENV
ncbi:MAG TPA: transglycosylase SLT domain-containing protein [Bacteroidota bacterium]|nr:transglycosylase SLT domain-containing protein [Bacteroidota bacterium]